MGRGDNYVRPRQAEGRLVTSAGRGQWDGEEEGRTQQGGQAEARLMKQRFTQRPGPGLGGGGGTSVQAGGSSVPGWAAGSLSLPFAPARGGDDVS